MKRLCKPKNDITERQAYQNCLSLSLSHYPHPFIIRYTKPLPDKLVLQVVDQLFNGELSEEEKGEQEQDGIRKKKFRWRGKRRMNAAAGLRLVQKMGEKMALNEGMVTPFLKHQP
jgi:hypothetical protein